MLRRSLLVATIVASALPAAAQNFPSRPVAIVVPFAAGGPTDAVARLISEAMGRDLGQSVIVENVGGAGGTLGAARVANARPDGYTLLLHHIGMATAPILYRRLPYDGINGFEPIGLITAVPMTVVVPKDHPAKTFQELVAWIREKKEDVNLGNAGLGAASQLCGTLLQHILQTPMTTVPFRGTGPAMTELLAGRLHVMCDQSTNTVEQIKGGGIRALAVTTPERLAVLPDVPTTIRSRHARSSGQHLARAVCAEEHAGTHPGAPQPVAAGGAARRKGGGPVRPAWHRAEPQDRATPAAHRAFWQAELAKWRPVLQAAGQYAD